VPLDWKSAQRITRPEVEAMDRLLVAIFENETRALLGLHALKGLDQEGTISVYATALIAKDSKRVLRVKQAPEGPAGAVVALFTGSLLGLLGGPVGLSNAASVGTLGGVLLDLAKLGVNEDFLTEVGHRLRSGTVGVVAEVWEERITPVDTRIEALGGLVLRRARVDVADVQIEREVASLQAELAGLEGGARARPCPGQGEAVRGTGASEDRTGHDRKRGQRETQCSAGEAVGRATRTEGQARGTDRRHPLGG